MFVVGLSGGIGSGKSTVGALFEKLGIEVIDADDIARSVVSKGSKCLMQIEQYFGSDILLEDSTLNRTKLRQIIFEKPEHKKWLEQLIHPIVQQTTTTKIAASDSQYVIYISPLLVEQGIPNWVNRTLIIDCDESDQRKRTMIRDNNSIALVDSIMANQASRQQRLAVADDIIHNDSTPEALLTQVNDLHQSYLLLSKQR